MKSVVSTINIGRTASYAKKPEDAEASRDATTGNVNTDGGGQRGGKNTGPLETPKVALEGSSPRRSHRWSFGKEPNRYVALTHTVKKRLGQGEKSEAARRTQSEKTTRQVTTELQDQHASEPASIEGASSANSMKTASTSSSKRRSVTCSGKSKRSSANELKRKRLQVELRQAKELARLEEAAERKRLVAT